MSFRVSGKHIELGEALRERISARVLGVDQLLDVVTDGFRRMGFAAVGGRDRGGEEVL